MTTPTSPLIVPTSPPIPVILQPSVIRIAYGRTLLLEGNATDIDEGAITAPGLFRWSSDRDGALGQGRELYERALSRGVHVITLEVRDAEGKIGRTSVRAYVGVAVPANTF